MSFLIDFQLPVRLFNFLGFSKDPIPKVEEPIRVGLLGASKVATYAVIWPARRMPEVTVRAVAARDPKRAAAYAKYNRIDKAYGSYQQLLDDPDIDAVYIGLPAGLHGEWSKLALAAGKHVLCEKPFTANAEEAWEVQGAARGRGLLCREAFHWREHPVATLAKRLLQEGAIGKLQRMSATVEVPDWTITKSDICWVPKLAGGAMMEAGCYCISAVRFFAQGQPRVLAAAPTPHRGCPGFIDEAMTGQLAWPASGVSGSFSATLQKRGRLLPTTEVALEGTEGRMTLSGFVMPFISHSLRVERSLPGGPPLVQQYQEYGTQESQYFYQLQRFARHALALKGRPSPCGLEEVRAAMVEDEQQAVGNMQVLSDVYRAAGLPQRVPSSSFLDSMVLPLQGVGAGGGGVAVVASEAAAPLATLSTRPARGKK